MLREWGDNDVGDDATVTECPEDKAYIILNLCSLFQVDILYNLIHVEIDAAVNS